MCDTIEGLRLAYYELLYKYLYKIDKRLVISIVLHQAWRVYTVKSRLTIYWKEYMLMQSHKKLKDFVWNPVMPCQVGHPSQRQHDCLMMNENERWQMYGLQAIERVNGKRMVWNEFAEAMRVLKLAVDRDVLEHLQQLEKIQILRLSIH